MEIQIHNDFLIVCNILIILKEVFDRVVSFLGRIKPIFIVIVEIMCRVVCVIRVYLFYQP